MRQTGTCVGDLYVFLLFDFALHVCTYVRAREGE